MRFAIIAGMAGFAVALQGWGWGARRLFGMRQGGWPVTLALGLGALIFLGGILNVVRLAVAPSLAALALAGLVLAVFDLRQRGSVRAYSRSERWRLAAILAPALAILAFTVVTQLPPSAYNAADDYAKYFFHPLRMLATGTLFASPMSDLGSETLGGKAFLDGFVAAFFPLSFLNATDGVFGLFLCLMLAGGFARSAWIATLCVLSVILIDPQYLNISALYLGSALMMAAIALSTDAAEMEGGIKPAATGLVYAGLIALKTTFALFVAVHFAFIVAAFFAWSLNTRRTIGFASKVSTFGALFLSPWIILHAPHYAAALIRAPNLLTTYGYGPDEGLTLFSSIRLTYGSSIIQFTLAMLVPFAAAVSLLWLARHAKGTQRLSMLMAFAAGGTGLVVYLIMFFVFGPQLSGHGESTRYFVPVAIAVVPAVLGVWASYVIDIKEAHRRLRFGLAMMVAALPVFIFVPSLLPRIEEAINERFILAFPFARSEDYRNLDTLVMSSGMRDRVRKMQNMVPAGQTLTVWINAPFYLDLHRNPVVDMDSAGLATPWAEFPDSGYVIWEFGGYAMPMARGGVANSGIVGVHERMVAGEELRFSQELRRFAQEGAVLYNDGRFAVIRMPGTG